MSHDPSNTFGRRARLDEGTMQSPDMHRETAVGGGCGCDTGAADSQGCGTGLGAATTSALEKIESELRAFELAERQRLGLEPDPAHWND